MIKFGTEVVLKGGSFLGWVEGQPTSPHPLGIGCIKGVWCATGASGMHFGENVMKQKLQGTPDLMEWVTFLNPKSGSGRIWVPCPSVAMVTHNEGEFIKSKLHYMSLIVIWLGWTPHTLTLGSRGPKRGCILVETLSNKSSWAPPT